MELVTEPMDHATIRRHAIGIGLAVIAGVYTVSFDLWVGPVLQESPGRQGQLLAFIIGCAFLLSATFANGRPALSRFLLLVGGVIFLVYAVAVAIALGTPSSTYYGLVSVIPSVMAIVASFLIGPVDDPLPG